MYFPATRGEDDMQLTFWHWNKLTFLIGLMIWNVFSGQNNTGLYGYNLTRNFEKKRKLVYTGTTRYGFWCIIMGPEKQIMALIKFCCEKLSHMFCDETILPYHATFMEKSTDYHRFLGISYLLSTKVLKACEQVSKITRQEDSWYCFTHLEADQTRDI